MSVTVKQALYILAKKLRPETFSRIKNREKEVLPFHFALSFHKTYHTTRKCNDKERPVSIAVS